jgi:hypothetical protein
MAGDCCTSGTTSTAVKAAADGSREGRLAVTTGVRRASVKRFRGIDFGE